MVDALITLSKSPALSSDIIICLRSKLCQWLSDSKFTTESLTSNIYMDYFIFFNPTPFITKTPKIENRYTSSLFLTYFHILPHTTHIYIQSISRQNKTTCNNLMFGKELLTLRPCKRSEREHLSYCRRHAMPTLR